MVAADRGPGAGPALLAPPPLCPAEPRARPRAGLGEEAASGPRWSLTGRPRAPAPARPSARARGKLPAWRVLGGLTASHRELSVHTRPRPGGFAAFCCHALLRGTENGRERRTSGSGGRGGDPRTRLPCFLRNVTQRTGLRNRRRYSPSSCDRICRHLPIRKKKPVSPAASAAELQAPDPRGHAPPRRHRPRGVRAAFRAAGPGRSALRPRGVDGAPPVHGLAAPRGDRRPPGAPHAPVALNCPFAEEKERTACEAPPAVENGAPALRSEAYRSGDKVAYRCESGYRLRGPEEVTCRRGAWTLPPECVGRCSAFDAGSWAGRAKLPFSFLHAHPGSRRPLPRRVRNAGVFCWFVCRFLFLFFCVRVGSRL